MRWVFALLFAVAYATVPLAPQDQTTIAPAMQCTDALVPDDFGPNNLTDYFCKDYLRGIVATGQGIELNLVVMQSGWFPNTWEILQFFDNKVRDGLIDFHYDTYCSYNLKVFQACSTVFRACNSYNGTTFESIPYCYETCLYLHPCLHQDCTEFDTFDSDNLTHCVVPAEFAPSAASSVVLALFAALL
jgi:hypothetical protein